MLEMLEESSEREVDAQRMLSKLREELQAFSKKQDDTQESMRRLEHNLCALEQKSNLFMSELQESVRALEHRQGAWHASLPLQAAHSGSTVGAPAHVARSGVGPSPPAGAGGGESSVFVELSMLSVAECGGTGVV